MVSTPAMGGTALSILSPCTAERAGSITVEAMIAEGLTKGEDRGTDLSGGWYSADGLPYHYSVETPDFETEPEDLQRLERATGVKMLCQIQLHIFVSDLVGRPALARMAEEVARRSEGWVLVEFVRPPAAALIDSLLHAGRAVRLDDHALYLDAAAMAAWIVHPDFHVIK